MLDSSKKPSKKDDISSNYSLESHDVSLSIASSSFDKTRQSYDENSEKDGLDSFGRTNNFNIFSIARPHMRAFQFAWLASFVCNFAWFSIAPFLKNIRDQNKTSWLNGSNFTIQNALSVLGPIFSRIALGPIVDHFGPKRALCGLMLLFSLPVFLIGISQTFWQWAVARFFIGFLAAEQTATKTWINNMFSSDITGIVSATNIGLGGMGPGVSAMLMPQVFNVIVRAGIREKNAWRISMMFPGIILVLLSLFVYFFSDEYPIDGDIKRHQEKEMKSSKYKAMEKCKLAYNWRIWTLCIQNALTFGVTIVLLGNLSTYLQDSFHITQENAGLLVGMYTLPTLMACSIGGYLSDIVAKSDYLRGRVALVFLSLAAEGLALFGFSRASSLSIAIPCLLVLSFMIYITAGTVFSVVPFVDTRHVGTVSGIVSAGSGVGGAIIGSIVLSNGKEGMSRGFMISGLAIISEAIIVGALNIMLGGWNHIKRDEETSSDVEAFQGV